MINNPESTIPGDIRQSVVRQIEAEMEPLNKAAQVVHNSNSFVRDFLACIL